MLNTWEEADAATELFETLDQFATVYGPVAGTGRYTNVLKTYLPCRLVLINTMSPQSGGARTELMAARDFYWDPAWTMPETAQVVVDGVRWQIQAGTIQPMRAGSSAVLLYRCSVIRQQTSSF